MFVPSLRQAIERNPITTTADTSAEAAIDLMSRVRASCVLVVQQSVGAFDSTYSLLGIFTERDVVGLIASGAELKDVAIAKVMTKQVLTLQESPTQAQDLVTVLTLFREHRIRHLPVLDTEGQLLGLITHQSIRTVLQPIDFMRLRRVAEVMTTRVIHASLKAPVLHLAQLMSIYHVSCVVIAEAIDKQELEPPDTTGSVWSTDSCPLKAVQPVGIVTERDLVQFRNLGLDLANLPAATVMSTPLFPIRPQTSLWEAHQQMQHHHVHRLVVAGEQGELMGILTQTSLVHALDPVEMFAEIDILQQLLQQSESQREALLKQLVARNKLLESLALTDQLTGLPNRRAMDQALPQLLQPIEVCETGYMNRYVSVFIMDVDYFKRVNDTYGHTVGDCVLQAIAERLQSEANSASWLYRYGGEEFVCIVPGISPEAAWDYGESLRLAIAHDPIEISEDLSIPVTISIGGAIAKLRGPTTSLTEAIATPTNAVDTQELFHLADLALYQAKREGRNCLRMSPIPKFLIPPKQPLRAQPGLFHSKYFLEDI